MNNDQTSVDVVIPSYRPDEKFSRLVKKLPGTGISDRLYFCDQYKGQGRFPKRSKADGKGKSIPYRTPGI